MTRSLKRSNELNQSQENNLSILKFEWYKRKFKEALELKDPALLIKLVRPFIEDFLYIRDKNNDLIKLKLNYTQDYTMKVIELLWKHRVPVRIIILKARQEGISTLIEAILFTLTIMLKRTRSSIISYSHKSVINIYNMSDRFYVNLPKECQPETKYYTKENMYFKSEDQDKNLDSEIVIDQGKNTKSSRSETLNNLHISEMALMEEVGELLTSVFNSLPKLNPFTFGAIESTAFGVGGSFHGQWRDGIDLEKVKWTLKYGEKQTLINKCVKIFIPWFWQKEYKIDPPSDFVLGENDKRYGDEKGYKKKYKLSDAQMYWRRVTIDGPECRGDLDEFRQEYPATEEEAFIASGRTRFPKDILEEMMNLTKPPIDTGYLKLIKDIDKNNKRPEIEFIHNPAENLQIWEFPLEYRLEEQYDHRGILVGKKKFKVHYVIGVDVAEGKIVTGKKADRSVVTVIRRDNLEQVAKWKGYCTPAALAEIIYLIGYYYNFAWLGVEKNNHGYTVIDRIQHKYGMLYYRMIIHEKTLRKTKEFGWYTGSKERPILIDDIETALIERSLVINSIETIEELLTFIVTNRGKPEAQVGSWDDEVFSLGIALQMHKLMPQVDHDSRPPVMSSYSMSNTRR